MKLEKFRNDKHYVRVQQRTVLRRGIGPFFTDVEIKSISDWIARTGAPSKKGICHGARNGCESDEFMKHITHADVIGTDLFPHSGKSKNFKMKSRVIERDFSKENPKWIGKFDFVYSNSLDHARYPEKTLDVWMSQLQKKGNLFIQWRRDHGDGGVSGGDCFGANIFEIIKLIDTFGKVVELLYTNPPRDRTNPLRRRRAPTIVIVANKTNAILNRRQLRRRERLWRQLLDT